MCSVSYQVNAEERFFCSHYEYFIRTRVLRLAVVFFSLGCCGNMSTRCTFPPLGSHWCQMLTVAPTMLQLWCVCLQARRLTKLESWNCSIFPEMPSAQRATGQRGGGGSKRETRGFLAQGYKLPWFFFLLFPFPPSLIFQRNSGDFTVTFSDSLVSHCVWAGVRSDPSRCVVFAAPSSAPRVSGQISSHVIAVFISKLQQIASCVPVLEASIGKSSFLEFCTRNGKPQTLNRSLSPPRGFPQLCVMDREMSQIMLKSSKSVTQIKGKVYNYDQWTFTRVPVFSGGSQISECLPMTSWWCHQR